MSCEREMKREKNKTAIDTQRKQRDFIQFDLLIIIWSIQFVEPFFHLDYDENDCTKYFRLFIVSWRLLQCSACKVECNLIALETATRPNDTQAFN